MRAARVVTEITTPAASVSAISVLCGIVGEPGLSGVLWGLFAALFCGVIPYTVLEVAARRGRISNRHVTDKAHRPWAYAMCLASVVIGIAVMLLLGAPALITWMLLTMVVGLVMAAGITAVGPKVSMHTMCFTVLGVLGVPLVSPWWLALLVVGLPAIVWSRLQLAHHTALETALGIALGVVIAWASWMYAPL